MTGATAKVSRYKSQLRFFQTKVRDFFNVLSSLIAKVTIVLTIILTAVMVAILAIGIFYRYALQDALSWSDEVAVLLFTWITFLVSSLGVREGFHVQITLVQEAMPQWLQRGLRSVINVGILVFGIVLFLSGDGAVASVSGQTSSSLGFPLWLLYVSVPTSGILIIIHAIAQLWFLQETGAEEKGGIS